jgi:two-component system cell cycle response regulator DivK
MGKGSEAINLPLKNTGMPGPRKILLVDDDVDHLSICKLVLTNRGYNVLVLWSTNVLIEVIKDFMPDLIFMDHRMPDMDGIQATGIIKSNPLTQHIPVIYFTGMEKGEELAKKAGANGYLAKPFKIDQMVAVIEEKLLAG